MAVTHASQPLFTSPKVFNTTPPAKPFSHWLKTPLSPLRSSLREKNTNTRPSEMPPKGKKSPFKPAIPPFEVPGLFGLPSVSGSSTPTGTTFPTKRQRSDTLSPSLPHWERLGKDPRGYWSARLHESKLSSSNTGPLSLSLEVTSYLDEMAKDFNRKLDFIGELLHTERVINV